MGDSSSSGGAVLEVELTGSEASGGPGLRLTFHTTTPTPSQMSASNSFKFLVENGGAVRVGVDPCGAASFSRSDLPPGQVLWQETCESCCRQTARSSEICSISHASDKKTSRTSESTCDCSSRCISEATTATDCTSETVIRIAEPKCLLGLAAERATDVAVQVDTDAKELTVENKLSDPTVEQRAQAVMDDLLKMRTIVSNEIHAEARDDFHIPNRTLSTEHVESPQEQQSLLGSVVEEVETASDADTLTAVEQEEVEAASATADASLEAHAGDSVETMADISEIEACVIDLQHSKESKAATLVEEGPRAPENKETDSGAGCGTDLAKGAGVAVATSAAAAGAAEEAAGVKGSCEHETDVEVEIQAQDVDAGSRSLLDSQGSAQVESSSKPNVEVKTSQGQCEAPPSALASRARALGKILPGVVAWRCEGRSAGHLQISKWNITEDGQLVLTCPKVAITKRDSHSSQDSQCSEKPLATQNKRSQESSEAKKPPANASTNRVQQAPPQNKTTNNTNRAQQRPPAQSDSQNANRGKRRVQTGPDNSRCNQQPQRANVQSKQYVTTGNQRTQQPAAAGAQRRQQSPAAGAHESQQSPSAGVQRKVLSPSPGAPRRQISPSVGSHSRQQSPRVGGQQAGACVRRTPGSYRVHQYGQRGRRSPATRGRKRPQQQPTSFRLRSQQLNELGMSHANPRHKPLQKGAWRSQNPLAAMAPSVRLERPQYTRPRCCERLVIKKLITSNLVVSSPTMAETSFALNQPKDDPIIQRTADPSGNAIAVASNNAGNILQPISTTTFVEKPSIKDTQIMHQSNTSTSQPVDKDTQVCPTENNSLTHHASLVNAWAANKSSIQNTSAEDHVVAQTAQSYTLPEISTWSFPLPEKQHDQRSESSEDAQKAYNREGDTQQPDNNLQLLRQLKTQDEHLHVSELYTDPCLQTLAQASLQVKRQGSNFEIRDEILGKRSEVGRHVHYYKHTQIKQQKQHDQQEPKHIISTDAQEVVGTEQFQARSYAAQKLLAGDVLRFRKHLSALADAVHQIPVSALSEDWQLPDATRNKHSSPNCDVQHPPSQTTSTYHGNPQMQPQLLKSSSRRLVVPQPQIMQRSTTSIRPSRSRLSRGSDQFKMQRNPSTSSRRSDTSNGSISHRDRKPDEKGIRVNKKLMPRRVVKNVDAHRKYTKKLRENHPLKVVSTHSPRCKIKMPNRPRTVTPKDPPSQPLVSMASRSMDVPRANAAYCQQKTFAPALGWNVPKPRVCHVPVENRDSHLAVEAKEQQVQQVPQDATPSARGQPPETVNSQRSEVRERLTMAVCRALRPLTSFQPIIEETVQCVEEPARDSKNELRIRSTNATHREEGSKESAMRSRSEPQAEDALNSSASFSDDSFTVKSFSLNSFSPNGSSECCELEEFDSELESNSIEEEDSHLYSGSGTPLTECSSDSSACYSQSMKRLRRLATTLANVADVAELLQRHAVLVHCSTVRDARGVPSFGPTTPLSAKQ
ncbi:Protein of unknown function [Gryllus bimaculatus]|nr:Protein of unknown function [Gryllus bimaculatus]